MPRASIPDILKANPMKMYFNQVREKSRRLSMHITGRDFKEAIVCMDEFETEQKKNLRQTYSRSNRDIFERIHRPITKVFSATGGSLDLRIKDEKLKKRFAGYLQNIRKGMSLRKWVQSIALPAYQVDPCGVILIEINDKGEAYPTYKGTCDIFYYETDGRDVNYIILALSKKEAQKYGLQVLASSPILDRMRSFEGTTAKYYRIIDDVSDKIVEWDGDSITEIPELSLPNIFMRCPAMVITDIFQFDSDEMLSPDDPIVELANSILTQNSVFEIWKNLHMFPKHWRMQSVCPKCMGNKLVAGATCSDCGGTGYQKKASVRDEIIVPMPDMSGDKVNIPTQFDGYTTPPADAWDLSTGDLDRLYNHMFQTHWGYLPDGKARVQVHGDSKTATQVLDESTSKTERLYEYSAWAESIERFVIDMCGWAMYGSVYGGCSVNYGDRYVMEGPDEIWKKYDAARKSGAPQAVLDSLLLDYYESKYFGSPVMLQIALKQMRVEPWVHLSIMDTQRLSATTEDKACKMYFSEWCSLKITMEWLTMNEDALRIDLKAYVAPKLLTIAAEVKEAALEAEFAPANKPGMPANKPTPA